MTKDQILKYPEVSKEKFYAVIGPTDTILEIINPYSYPYVTHFKLRYGKTMGYSIGGIYPEPNRYFLPA